MNKRLPIAALILVQVIFGLNYAASKIILESYPPLLWGAVRMLIAAILMFGCSFFLVPKIFRKYDLSFLMHTFIYSIFGITLCQGFFLYGLHLTTTANSAVINTLTPIFTLIIAIILKQEKFTTLKVTGVLMAFIGVLSMRNLSDFQLSSETLKGDFFTLLSCLSLALFFILSRDFLKKNSSFWVTAWMFLMGGVVLSAFSIFDYGKMVEVSMTSRLGMAIAYNIIAGTMITYFLNSWTLTKVNSSLVTLFFYLQPVIAVLNAWFGLHEAPSTRILLAMVLIFSGVSLGVLKRG